MDTFIENIVKKQPSQKDLLMRVGLILGGIILIFLSILLFFILPLLGILGVIGVIFGFWYLWSSMDVEYEYIFTNGELDVDKIIARRKRSRLITVNVKTFDKFGKCNGISPQGDYDSRVMACSTVYSDNAYFAIFKHHTLGSTLLVFNPDKRMIERMANYLPRGSKNA